MGKVLATVWKRFWCWRLLRYRGWGLVKILKLKFSWDFVKRLVNTLGQKYGRGFGFWPTCARHDLKQLFWWKNVTFGSVVPLTMFLTIPETQTKLQMYICKYVLYSILIITNHVSVLRTRRAWLWTLLGRTLLIFLRRGELNLGKWRNLGSDQTSSGRSKPRQI